MKKRFCNNYSYICGFGSFFCGNSAWYRYVSTKYS